MPESPATLAAALVQLQARLPHITKTAEGQYGKYADLHVITEAIRPVLIELSLLWVCLPTLMDGQFVLDYYMLHEPSGDRGLDGFYPLTSATPQGRGAEITYARRYSLCSALNIAPAGEDDDGQAAQSEADQWRPPANPHSRKADRHNAARSGPLPDDDWTDSAPDETPGSITDGRKKELGYWFTKAGITSSKDRLSYAQARLDRPELTDSDGLSEADGIKLAALLKEEGR